MRGVQTEIYIAAIPRLLRKQGGLLLIQSIHVKHFHNLVAVPRP